MSNQEDNKLVVKVFKNGQCSPEFEFINCELHYENGAVLVKQYGNTLFAGSGEYFYAVVMCKELENKLNVAAKGMLI